MKGHEFNSQQKKRSHPSYGPLWWHIPIIPTVRETEVELPFWNQPALHGDFTLKQAINKTKQKGKKEWGRQDGSEAKSDCPPKDQVWLPAHKQGDQCSLLASLDTKLGRTKKTKTMRKQNLKKKKIKPLMQNWKPLQKIKIKIENFLACKFSLMWTMYVRMCRWVHMEAWGWHGVYQWSVDQLNSELTNMGGVVSQLAPPFKHQNYRWADNPIDTWVLGPSSFHTYTASALTWVIFLAPKMCTLISLKESHYKPI